MLEQFWIKLNLSALPPFYSYTFAELKGKFSAQPMHDKALLLLCVMAALILILCCAMICLRFYRRRRHPGFTPAGWVTSPQRIRAILEAAVLARNTFEVQFPEKDNYRRPILRCSPENITPDSLSLEASGVSTLARQWVGRQINCYFRITIKEQPVYYAFSARIARVESKLDNRCDLCLHLPEKIENRQKRSFLRIVPPDEYILGAAIWQRAQLPPENVKSNMLAWPEPSMSLIPGSINDFVIHDLSSGGLRIIIPKTRNADGFKTEFAISEQLIIQLDLLDPEGQKRLRFRMLCRVQNTSIEFETQNLGIGLQFLAWAQPDGANSSSLQWLRLTYTNEVDPLGNWIIRRHLELFREKHGEDA